MRQTIFNIEFIQKHSDGKKINDTNDQNTTEIQSKLKKLFLRGHISKQCPKLTV